MVQKTRKPNKRKGPKEPKEFLEEVLEIRRVTRVVKGGRRLRFRAAVVVGNKKGKVGLGLGKSNEVSGAIQKAINQAKKRMIDVPVAGGTIPHELNIKFKSAKILLLPAREGTGLIVGGAVRKVVELCGIRNLRGKSHGSTNKVNNAKATITALLELVKNPHLKIKDEEIKTVKTDNETSEIKQVKIVKPKVKKETPKIEKNDKVKAEKTETKKTEETK